MDGDLGAGPSRSRVPGDFVMSPPARVASFALLIGIGWLGAHFAMRSLGIRPIYRPESVSWATPSGNPAAPAPAVGPAHDRLNSESALHLASVSEPASSVSGAISVSDSTPSADTEAACRAFTDWLERWRPGSEPWPEAVLQEGIALARARRAILEALIPLDPKQVLARTISWSIRQRLPSAIVAELEEPVAARGRLEVFCATQWPAGGRILRTFTFGDRRLEAYVYGRRLRQISASGVGLYGVAIGDRLAIHEDCVQPLEADEAAAAMATGRMVPTMTCALTGVALQAGASGIEPVVVRQGDQLFALANGGLVTELNQRLASIEPGFRSSTEPPEFESATRGIKRALFLRARFPDDLREPITEAEAAEVMQLANGFLVANSFNTLSLITTVGPLVTLPQPKLYYAVRGAGVLLDDARTATREAGIDWETFDLDLVRFENVPGFDWAGLASVGGRGVWLQNSALGVVCHELGHNLGLAHANFWNTVRPDPPEDPRNLPFDPDSLVGLDSVIGPGDDVEYGDPFDVMGSGGEASAHFGGLHKYLLGWLPAAGLETVSDPGVYRVHAHDAGVLGPGLHQLLRVRKDAERFYWIDARSLFAANPWSGSGVELHWNNWHQAIASAQLLDTTPGSQPGRTDAALVLGRSFVDAAAGLVITPITRGATTIGGVRVPYYDVSIAIGSTPGNTVPELELSASSLAVGVNQPVTLAASAIDTDGDPVVFAWELGEGRPGPSQGTVTWQWAAPGDYVVRAEASDLRGGTTSKHLVVQVGQVNTLRITGRVIDQRGLPLARVRVHNGQPGTNSPYADDYRWAYTDSEGRYSLVGLQPGSYPVGAVLAGYAIRPLNFSRPLVLNEFTGVNVDFVAAALPRVSATLVASGEEAGPRPAVFRIARDGPTNDTLRVFFRTTGSAREGTDYQAWPSVEVQTNSIPTALDPVVQTLPFGFVDLPPGAVSTNLSFPVLRDTAAEGEETLVLTLVYPVTRTTISETETNLIDIPGWEVLSDNGQETWYQTRPAYQVGAPAEATARILDAAAATDTVISLVALATEASENDGDSISLAITRVGRVPQGSLTIPLAVGGTATPGDDYEALPAEVILPAGAEAARLVLRVLDDRFVEGNESVLLTLGPGTGYRLGTRSATVTIVDNDLPLVSVTAIDPVVPEAAEAARVVFQRTGDLERPLEVDYLLGGTATAGADYASLPGRVTIPAGASAATLLIQPIDDTAFEGDETVEIQVGDSPVYNLAGPGRTVVRLRDDEFPAVTVEASDAEAAEPDDPGQFLIRRTGSLASALLVRYRLGGSAVHQADYVASGDQLLIPAGRATAVIPVIPIDDGFREDTETVSIELLPDPAYSLGDPARAAIDLQDAGDLQPAVGFALLTSGGPESATQPELAVRISGNPDEGPENAVTVAWEVLGGTASNGTDYVLTNGTLVFSYTDPEGGSPLTNRLAFIPLQVVDDAIAEPEESVLIRLRIAPTVIPSEDTNTPPTLVTNGVLDVYPVHTYTIRDDDLAEVRVTATSPSTAEGASAPAVFTVRRVGSTNLAQTVVFQLSGLATPGADYLDPGRSVTFRPGQSTATVEILPIDDPVVEYLENVILSLVSAPGARLGASRRAEIGIADNDGTIEFTSARWSVIEGTPEAWIQVRRTGDTNLLATARFEAVPGTAQPAILTNQALVGDFHPTNGFVEFAPGEILREFAVRLLDDERVEEPKTIELLLTRGSDLFPLGGQNAATLTVLDNDALISTGTNLAAGIESEGVVVVTLERSGPLDRPLFLDFRTADLAAVAGEDYLPEVGTLEFPAGQREARLMITLLDDFLLEGDEALVLRFFAADATLVGEVPVVIVDDECRIEFANPSSGAEVDEDGGVVELNVIRIGSPLMPVLVDFEAVSGTATVGEDFGAVSGSLLFQGNRFEVSTNGTGEVVFVPGETNRVITVPIINDRLGERDEVFQVELARARAGSPGLTLPFVTLGAASNLLVTIRDNEVPGRVDDGFQPGLGANAPVRAIALQTDGKILAGGEFGTLDGVVLPSLARLHADGFLDRSFNPGRGFDGAVLAVLEIADGRLLAGGGFGRADGADQPFLSRLEPDGTRAADFAARPDGPVHSLILAESGILVGGEFTQVAGYPSPGVARLTRDGELDRAFSTGPMGRSGVRALAELEDGRILAGGTFAAWGGAGAASRFLVRLLSDGAPEPSLGAALAPNGVVHALVKAADGTVYVGGEFTSIGALPRRGVARLFADGRPDPVFDPGSGPNGPVLALGLQGSGRVVVAGAFTAFGDLAAGRFVRLEPDGALDGTFFRGAGANDTIRALAVQPDGAFLVGGDFTAINERPRLRLARIHADEQFAEGFIEFSAPVFRISESEATATATIGIRRTGAGKEAARVRFATFDATATAGSDYQAVTIDVAFAPGETNRLVTIPIRDDDLAEGTETVSLLLAQVVGAQLGRQATAALLIEDDEAAIAWERSTIEVAEDAGILPLALQRSGSLAGPAAVSLVTDSDSAVEGLDFEPVDGRLEFLPGEAVRIVRLRILDDSSVEGPETFRLRLIDPSAGLTLGSQSVLAITIIDDDRNPTHHTLTIEPSPGGFVVPGGGRFPTNSVVSLRAFPDPGFEFARWEGTVASADNPIALLMDRDQVLSARFRTRDYLETFENGDFSRLPWINDSNAPWQVTNETASGGAFSARSGRIRDRGVTALALEFETGSGGGSFDFRTASEAHWDFLEFLVDGRLIERWSGNLGWQTFQFDVAAGRHRFEWRFERDPTFGGDSDAVWIDNLDLPEVAPEVRPPRLSWSAGQPGCAVEVSSTAGRRHVLERSADLRQWTPVNSVIPDESAFRLSDPDCSGAAPRFYRVRVD